MDKNYSLSLNDRLSMLYLKVDLRELVIFVKKWFKENNYTNITKEPYPRLLEDKTFKLYVDKTTKGNNLNGIYRIHIHIAKINIGHKNCHKWYDGKGGSEPERDYLNKSIITIRKENGSYLIVESNDDYEDKLVRGFECDHHSFISIRRQRYDSYNSHKEFYEAIFNKFEIPALTNKKYWINEIYKEES